MNRPTFLSLAFAGGLLSAGSICGQTVATDPVGFTNTPLPAESDSYLSVPFTRPPEFVGGIQSAAGNTITVNGTPGWSTNQFVYAAGTQSKRYYALIGSGGSSNPKEGHTFFVSGNGSNTLTVDTSVEDVSGVTANTQVTLIPYWTLGTIFPSTDSNVSFTPSTSSSSFKTQVRIPDDTANGVNLPYIGTYYFSSNVDGTSNNSGWRKEGDANTADHGDDILLPDSYFVVRHQNGAPALPFTALGSVLLKKFSVPLRTLSSGPQDNPVSILRPIDVTLNMTGLSPADGSFRGSNGSSQGDQLLLFSNSEVGIDKVTNGQYAVYYRDASANNIWRLAGDSTVVDRGNDVIPLGTGFIVRKAQAPTGNVFWTNSFPVQALSAVSRKTHGGAGSFDINLPLTGKAGIESRNPVNGFQIVVTFPTAVTFSGANVTSGSASIASASGSGTSTAVINLTSATNGKYVTVTLQSVNDGANVGDLSVQMGVLYGDANGDGFVNSGDSTYTRNRSGLPADASNFRADSNADGTINSGDSTVVRNNSGSGL